VTERAGTEEEQRYWRELAGLREELALLLTHHAKTHEGVGVREARGRA
jgi:hypothetical protein